MIKTLILLSILLYSTQSYMADTIVLDPEDALVNSSPEDTIIRLSAEEAKARNDREAKEEAAEERDEEEQEAAEAEEEAAEERNEAEQEAAEDSTSEKQVESVRPVNDKATLKTKPGVVNKIKEPASTDRLEKNRSKKVSMKTKRERFKYIKKMVRTSSGQGAKLSDIETVWVHMYFNAAVGTVIVETSLLFKDGLVYMNCTIPPTELNVQQSKKLQVAGDVYKRGKWSEWRETGSGYEVKRNGSWRKLEGIKALTGNRNEALNAEYTTAGGSQIKGSWKRNLKLKSNGRFEMRNFSMKDNSMMGGGDTSPLISSVYNSDKRGSKSSISVAGDSEKNIDIGGGVSNEKKNGSKNTGSYIIDDYRIILEHDNGLVHSELFYFYKNKNYIVYKDGFFSVPKELR